MKKEDGNARSAVAAAENPFRVSRLEMLRYRAPGFDWDAFLERIAGADYRGAIIGPHGHGKTILLRELAMRLEGRGFTPLGVFLKRGRPGLTPELFRELRRSLGPRNIVLLDGAEQLGSWTWRRFRYAVRRASGLIITTHRAGRLPTLYECRTSPELLEEILPELVPEDPFPLRDYARRLFFRHQGDFHKILLALYDFCAEGAGTPDFGHPPDGPGPQSFEQCFPGFSTPLRLLSSLWRRPAHKPPP